MNLIINSKIINHDLIDYRHIVAVDESEQSVKGVTALAARKETEEIETVGEIIFRLTFFQLLQGNC